MKTLPTPWDHVVMVVGGETSPSHSPQSLNPGEKLGVILEPVLLLTGELLCKWVNFHCAEKLNYVEV